ncbi:outer membrane beta-barrel protein [Flavivirga eckloniae]|uniref:Cell envelope biogenesis protein OmpA n=1 Tax=Flavivirga eckloniae TaxID=1803846 RepID=A0A2K9PSY2_9FLAO|nr:outer membrane beta-barrel protein [Flavivirga eckloniae]AUP80149.1 cell envelope biogenesis protein OmpA [Flavivirga eckloniae]
MTSNLKTYKKAFCAIALIFICFVSSSQGNTSTFKAQFALGLNSPTEDGFVTGFEGKTINFPSVNVGVQYMFRQALGAKLDYGFNRMSNKSEASEFKLNYTRVNLQLVYNANRMFNLSQRTGVFVHAGPGYSNVSPLGNFTQNKTSFMNAMAGIEFHHGISDKLSIYADLAYVHGFLKDFSPVTDGYGSFNGNLVTLTIGASISLSGCYYCDQYD